MEKYNNTFMRLLCLEPTATLPLAYYRFRDPPGRMLFPEPDIAFNLLRLQALTYDESFNRQKIKEIREMEIKEEGFDEQAFIDMFEKSIPWAEAEKRKSADELYQLSKTMPPTITIADTKMQKAVREFFGRQYLLLASEKGSKKAREEIDKRHGWD